MGPQEVKDVWCHQLQQGGTDSYAIWGDSGPCEVTLEAFLCSIHSHSRPTEVTALCLSLTQSHPCPGSHVTSWDCTCSGRFSQLTF